MSELVPGRSSLASARLRPRGLRLGERLDLGKIDLRGNPHDRAFMAAVVWLRARSSRTCPSRTNTVIMAAASKYTATDPSWRWKDGGSSPGATVATVLYA